MEFLTAYLREAEQIVNELVHAPGAFDDAKEIRARAAASTGAQSSVRAFAKPCMCRRGARRSCATE